MEKCLAIIPARSNSKRILNKNIKVFIDRPIICYSIETALKFNMFSEIMVSTDNEEIAELSNKYGAKVPFLRTDKTSGDYASISDVILEVLDAYKKIGREFEYFCCIFATAPFLQVDKLKEGLRLLKQGNYDIVIPVVKYSYPIQRALKIDRDNLYMICPENVSKRSQDLMKTYHDAGQFYWAKTKEFQRQKTFFAKKTGSLILSELEVHDIDNNEDWDIAEVKYKILKNRS